MNLDSDAQILSSLRLRIGNPPPTGNGAVYDYTLGLMFEDALQRLYDKLECRVTDQPTMILLQDGVFRYPLPPDVVRVLTVRIEGFQLYPDSVYRWLRDGLVYDDAQASKSARFALASRNLLLYPPPDLDEYTEPVFAELTYIGASPGLQPQGVEGLLATDAQTAMYDTAREFDALFPGDTPEEQSKSARRQASNSAQYNECLALSRKNWLMPAKLHAPRAVPGHRLYNRSR